MEYLRRRPRPKPGETPMAHPQRHARGQRYKHGLVDRRRSPSVRRSASPSRSRSPSPLGRRQAKADAARAQRHRTRTDVADHRPHHVRMSQVRSHAATEWWWDEWARCWYYCVGGEWFV